MKIDFTYNIYIISVEMMYVYMLLMQSAFDYT